MAELCSSNKLRVLIDSHSNKQNIRFYVHSYQFWMCWIMNSRAICVCVVESAAEWNICLAGAAGPAQSAPSRGYLAGGLGPARTGLDFWIECHSGTWWYGHLDTFCWLRLYSLYKSCMDYNVYFIVICIEVEETYIITLNSHYTWCNDKWLVNKEINVRRKVQWSIALLSKIPGRFSPPSQWLGQFQVPHQSIPTRLELQLSSFVLSLMKVYTWKFEVSPSDETFGTKGGFSFLLYTSSQSMPAKQKTIFLQFDHFLFTFEPFVIFDVISTVF